MQNNLELICIVFSSAHNPKLYRILGGAWLDSKAELGGRLGSGFGHSYIYQHPKDMAFVAMSQCSQLELLERGSAHTHQLRNGAARASRLKRHLPRSLHNAWLFRYNTGMV